MSFKIVGVIKFIFHNNRYISCSKEIKMYCVITILITLAQSSIINLLLRISDFYIRSVLGGVKRELDMLCLFYFFSISLP